MSFLPVSGPSSANQSVAFHDGVPAHPAPPVGTTHTARPGIDVPAADPSTSFQDARQQFGGILDALSEPEYRTGTALQGRVLDFLRYQGHEISPRWTEATGNWLKAASGGGALPDPDDCHSVRMDALVCQLVPAANGSDVDRAVLKQAMLAAYDSMHGVCNAPGLKREDREQVGSLLEEMVAYPRERANQKRALLSLLKRYGYDGRVTADCWTWARLGDGTRADDPALGLPQLLAAIDSMPANPELHKELSAALVKAIGAQAVQCQADQAVLATACLKGKALAHFNAIWHHMEQNVQAGSGAFLSRPFGLNDSEPMDGEPICYRGASGTRQAFQSYAQMNAGALGGLGLYRNADGTSNLVLDQQPVTDPLAIHVLLCACEKLMSRKDPEQVLEQAFQLLKHATGTDADQKIRAARFILAALVGVDPGPPAPQAAGQPLPARDPQAMLQRLDGIDTPAALEHWMQVFCTGMATSEDALAQARVDAAAHRGLSQPVDPESLCTYPRESGERRAAVVDELQAFARREDMFVLRTLFARAPSTREYQTPDGYARLTDMLCELQVALQSDPALARACNAFSEEHAVGCADRATLGLTGIGLMLNWWKVREDPVRALQAIRALVFFYRAQEAGSKMYPADGYTGETIEAALRFLMFARMKHLPLPDGGPRHMLYGDLQCATAATPERMDAALREISAASAQPALSSPISMSDIFGQDFTGRFLPAVTPDRLERACDEYEKQLDSFTYLGLLPDLVHTPLTVPVLKRLLLELVSPPGTPPSPAQSQLARMLGSLRARDGVSVAGQREILLRSLAGQLLEAVARRDRTFATEIAEKLSVGQSLEQQFAALQTQLRHDLAPTDA